MQTVFFSTNQTKLTGWTNLSCSSFKCTFDLNIFLLNHPLWWHCENCSSICCYVTNNIVVHASQFGSC